MVNRIEEFLNEKFGTVRAFKDTNSVIWFVAKDVADILGYANVTKVTGKIDDEDMISLPKSQLTNLGSWEQTGGRDVSLINEGGLYQTVLTITKKDMNRYEMSRDFKRWITNEVLPTLRDTGAYIEKDREEEVVDKYFFGLSDETKLLVFKELQANNEKLQVKASNWDKFLDTSSTYTFTEVAKMISTYATQDSGKMFKISNQALTEFLRTQEILSKGKSGGSYTNLPNQKFEEYFDVVSVKVKQGDFNKPQTRVKANGVEFIYGKLIEESLVN